MKALIKNWRGITLCLVIASVSWVLGNKFEISWKDAEVLDDENGKVYDIIAGPFLVVGLSEDDFASLSKEYQDKYYKMFEHPERFFRVGNEIQSAPIKSPELAKNAQQR